MLSKVQKWGNSQGIRIPKHLLEHSRIKIGEDVDIHVAVPAESSLTGYVIADQVNRSRHAKLIEKAPSGTLAEVLAILDACIYQDAD